MSLRICKLECEVHHLKAELRAKDDLIKSIVAAIPQLKLRDTCQSSQTEAPTYSLCPKLHDNSIDSDKEAKSGRQISGQPRKSL